MRLVLLTLLALTPLACTTPAPPKPTTPTPPASKIRALPGDIRVVLREQGALFACVTDLTPQELEAHAALLTSLGPQDLLTAEDPRLPERLRAPAEASHLIVGPGVRVPATLEGVALGVDATRAYFLKLEAGGDLPGDLALALRTQDTVERTRGRAPKTGALSDGDLAVLRKLLIENAQGPVPEDLPETFRDGGEVTAYIGNFPGDLRLLVHMDWEVEAPDAAESAEDAPLWHFSALMFLDRKGRVAHWVLEPKARPRALRLGLFTDLNDDGYEEVILEAHDADTHQISIIAPSPSAYEAPRTLLEREISK